MKRLISIVGVLLGAVLTVGGVAYAAAAPVTGESDGVDIRYIEANRLGKISIIKTMPNPYDDPRPGHKPNGPVAGQPVQIQAIQGIDLKNIDWNKLKKLTVEEVTAKAGPAQIAYTNSQGVATFRDLPVGLYLVSDIPHPDKAHSYLRIQPFLITLPVGKKGWWSYELEVTPKLWDPEDNLLPPQPPKPDNSQKSRWGKLPQTGTVILGVGLLASAFITGGFAVRRRKEEEE